MHIAILEDESYWIDRIRRTLDAAGWQGSFFRTGEDLLAGLGRAAFDAVILDMHIANSPMTGADVLSQLRRQKSPEPILMLTQFARQHSAAAALDEGADDYLAKPFDGDELCARIRAIRRRIAVADADMVHAGFLHLSRQFRCAHWFDRRINLRGQGFDILLMLVEADGDIVTQDALWQRVWAKWRNLDTQAQPIQAGVSRLRKDIREVTGFEVVATVPGVGYRLALG